MVVKAPRSAPRPARKKATRRRAVVRKNLLPALRTPRRVRRAKIPRKSRAKTTSRRGRKPRALTPISSPASSPTPPSSPSPPPAPAPKQPMLSGTSSESEQETDPVKLRAMLKAQRKKMRKLTKSEFDVIEEDLGPRVKECLEEFGGARTKLLDAIKGAGSYNSKARSVNADFAKYNTAYKLKQASDPHAKKKLQQLPLVTVPLSRGQTWTPGTTSRPSSAKQADFGSPLAKNPLPVPTASWMALYDGGKFKKCGFPEGVVLSDDPDMILDELDEKDRHAVDRVETGILGMPPLRCIFRRKCGVKPEPGCTYRVHEAHWVFKPSYDEPILVFIKRGAVTKMS